MRKLIITLFCFVYLAGNAQNYYCQNTTILDGLPDNAIRSLFEDSRGYIWIGTDAGVCSWDGESYIWYNTHDGLAGNKVWSIDEDTKGNLWFACFSAGISKFDGEKFTTYTKKHGLVDNYARVVQYSEYFDCILIGTNSSISVLKDSVFSNFSYENGGLTRNAIVTAILEDSSKAIFMDFANYHYNLRMDSNNTFSLERSDEKWLDKYGVSSAKVTSKGDTIIGWQRKGIVVNNNDTILELDSIGQVFGIAKDNRENLWLASWNGGISPPGGLFLFDNKHIKSLNSNYNINSIVGWSMLFSDDQNLIFYGTLDNGIYKIPPPYFEYYKPKYFNEKDGFVIDIVVDNNDDVWFNTDSIVVKWSPENIMKWDLNDFYLSRLNFEKTHSSNESLNNNIREIIEHRKHNKTSIVTLAKNNKNDVWAAVSNLGIFSLPSDPSGELKCRGREAVGSLAFDNAGTLFRGNEWLNFIYALKKPYIPDNVIKHSDSTGLIYAKKLVNYEDEIWAFSRLSGVYMLKDEELRILTNEDPTISKIVNDICFDENGNAYLGGNDGKIEILDAGSRKKINEIHHSDDDYPINWMEITHGKLFVGSSGILRVYDLDKVINGNIIHKLYRKTEGYDVKVVNNSALTSEGNILLATNDGIVKIDTKLILEAKYKPLKTIIKNVDIFNKPVNWGEYTEIDNWSGLPVKPPRLTLDQNHLSFFYHTINYNNTNEDSYYYKLKGVDNNWAGPTNKKYVVYPNLKPGKYTFMVKSRNKLSGLHSEGDEFSFIILRPWYLEPWLYIVIASVLLAILYTFYKYRIRYIKNREENKTRIMKKITDLEIKALQAQMNPHFLFNSMNAIQNYVLDNDVDKALLYLSSFSKVIRMTLDYVDKQFISLSDELAYLEHYVSIENMRFDNLINYDVLCDDEIDLEVTLIPPMILQPIIENSINHGLRNLQTKGTIKLEIVKLNDTSYKCIITDNGVGRVKSAEIKKSQIRSSNSVGLKITEERLSVLNIHDSDVGIKIIDLYNSEGDALGTRVEITLPLIFN